MDRPARPFAAAGLLALWVGACGRSPPPPVAEYPPYAPEEATLFDDSAAPEIFGFQLGGPAPGSDPVLEERVRRADSVARVRVSTVSREGVAAYAISVDPSGAPLAGRPLKEPLTLTVRQSAPAFPFVSARADSLLGKVVILFVRRYNEQGEVTAHWRLEPDEHAVKVAIQAAVEKSALE